MTYIPQTQQEEGGVDRTLTSDERVRSLLEEILVELKKIETHLSFATDTELKEQTNAN